MKKLADMLKISPKTMLYIMMLLFFLASLVAAVLTIDTFVEYSSLPVGLVKASLGIILLAIIDDVVFSKVDTITEIKNKNVAYAMVYLANAIIIAAGIGLA